MKKMHFSFLLLMFCGTQIMMSQVVQGTSSMSSSSDIRFGAKAGFNLSTLGGSGLYGYSAKPGFHVGGVADIPFSDIITIQPEVLLSLQGSGWDFDSNLNLFYLTVPVMVKYNVWESLNIEAGPQLGVLIADNADDNVYGIEDGNPDVNTIDFGLAVGAGYQLDDNFYFQLRFNVGFINAIKDFNSKNRVFQVSAVYFL